MAIPSGYTALDFVGFTDKGTYANNVTYVINDLVHYGGDIWKCKIDNTIGITPAVGANWEQWLGASANLVERIIAPLEQNPATVAYAIGRQIIYDDWLWEVIAPIAIGDTLVDYAVDPTNANIKKAPAVETQLLSLSSKAYQTDDSTETDIADDDLLPFYDTSATARKKSTWSNIIAKIKAKLGTAATKDYTTSVTSGSSNLVTSGAVYSAVDAALTNEVSSRVKLGAHNLLRNDATTQTVRGVTFTVYPDGHINVNGAVTRGYDYASIEINITQYFKKGSYILTGCPSGGSNSTWQLRVSNGFDASVIDVGSGANLSLANDGTHAIYCYCQVFADAGTVNIDFYPMIRLASDPSTEYTPYAMTNRELTNEFIFEDVTFDAVTVAANSAGHVDKNVTKAGYTPIGIVSINAFSGYVSVASFQVSKSSSSYYAYIYFSNASSVSQTGQYIATVMYRKA